MKSEDDIEARVRFLLVQELDRRVAEASRRLPHLCVHNHKQPLDTRRHVEGEPNETFNRVSDHRGLPVIQTMGLCMLGADNPEQWNGTICEDPIDAQKCPVFSPLQTKETLDLGFRRDVNDMVWVGAHMPELYGLLWALDRGTQHMALPWWKRLWYRVLKIRVDPVSSSHSAMKLLPSPESHADGL